METFILIGAIPCEDDNGKTLFLLHIPKHPEKFDAIKNCDSNIFSGIIPVLKGENIFSEKDRCVCLTRTLTEGFDAYILQSDTSDIFRAMTKDVISFGILSCIRETNTHNVRNHYPSIVYDYEKESYGLSMTTFEKKPNLSMESENDESIAIDEIYTITVNMTPTKTDPPTELTKTERELKDRMKSILLSSHEKQL